MRILLFFVLIMLVSCAKIKEEIEQKIQILFTDDSIEVVVEEPKPEVPEVMENQAVELKDTAEFIPVKEIEEQPIQKTETAKKPAESKIQKQKKLKQEAVETFVFNENYYPLTKEDAKNFALECYKKAKNMSNSDSVKIVIKKGLATFENASLYYLSAKQNAFDNNFLTAANLCKTAISRNDFWGNERNKTIKLLVDCLEKTYEKTPSDFLMSQINNYKEMLK